MKTTKEQIVKYWFEVVDIEESGLSVDAVEAHERCWRCGCKAKLERCHIIPHSLGGKDSQDNLVLLCHRCHIENPNVSDPQIMWDWIRTYGTPFYDTFWWLKCFEEYEFIYGKSLVEEIKERNIMNIKKFAKDVIENYKKTSIHFGHPYRNTVTKVGMIRMALKEYDTGKLLK